MSKETGEAAFPIRIEGKEGDILVEKNEFEPVMIWQNGNLICLTPSEALTLAAAIISELGDAATETIVTDCNKCPLHVLSENRSLHYCQSQKITKAFSHLLFSSCPLKTQPITIKLKENGK